MSSVKTKRENNKNICNTLFFSSLSGHHDLCPLPPIVMALTAHMSEDLWPYEMAGGFLATPPPALRNDPVCPVKCVMNYAMKFVSFLQHRHTIEILKDCPCPCYCCCCCCNKIGEKWLFNLWNVFCWFWHMKMCWIIYGQMVGKHFWFSGCLDFSICTHLWLEVKRPPARPASLIDTASWHSLLGGRGCFLYVRPGSSAWRISLQLSSRPAWLWMWLLALS